MGQPDRFVNRFGIKMKILTVTIPEADHDRLKDLAAREQTTLSAIARTLIKQRVEHLQGTEKVNRGI